MPKPKILQISHSYYNLAGTEKHVAELYSGLQEDFDLFVLFAEKEELVLLDPNGKEVRYKTGKLPWLIIPEHSAKHETFFEEVLRSVKPTIIHLHHLLNWPLQILNKIIDYNSPRFLSLHDYFMITPIFTMQGSQDPSECFSDEYAQRNFNANLGPYLRARKDFFLKALPEFNALISPSKYTAKVYQNVYQGNYLVLEHGIAKITSLPKVIPEDKQTVRLGYIGSLLPQKGWEVLIEAFRKLTKDYPNLELHLYGGAQEISEPNVFFHGIYRSNDLPNILSQIDLAIVPSVFAESYCYTLSELWAGNVPVIASRIGALAERIEEGINGRLFEAGNVQDLVRVLKECLEDQSYNSWQLPKPRTLTQMTDDYRALYKRVL